MIDLLEAANAVVPSPRFQSKIQKTETCWLWLAGTTHNGYGQIMAGSRTDGTRGSYRTHRLAYAYEHQVDPGELCVLHRCDIRACANPAHLFLGTAADNVADMMAKGRRVEPTRLRGEDHPKTTLTAVQVLEIFNAPREHGSGVRLAEKYGVPLPTISKIRYGWCWSHLTGAGR
jgi:hypothetical protein